MSLETISIRDKMQDYIFPDSNYSTEFLPQERCTETKKSQIGHKRSYRLTDPNLLHH